MRILVGVVFIFLLCPVWLSANTDSLKNALAHATHDKDIINICLELAKDYRNINTDSAMVYAQKAYETAKLNKDIEKQATAANRIGVVYLNKAQYDKALSYHLEAARLFEQIDDKRGLALTYNNIGSVNYHLSKYDEALSYYKKSLAIKLDLKLAKEASSTFANIGNIFMARGEYDSCIYYYTGALENARRNNDNYNISIALMNLGEAYIDIKKYPLAQQYYTDALKMNMQTGDKYHQANCYYALGKIYTETGKYADAESNLSKALAMVKKGGMKPVQLNIYRYYSQLYEKTGDHKRALEYYKKFHALNDTIFNDENAKRIEELKAGYESELKDRKIILAEERAQRAVIFRNTLVAAFIAAGIMIGILYRNTRLKKKTNTLLLEKNRQIELHQHEIEQKNNALAQYNKELMTENISVKYEVLKSKINPHFLFNSLSTLSTLILKNQKQAIEFVGRFSKLYRSILKSGDTLLVTLQEELNLAGHYLYMQKMRFGSTLDVHIDIPAEELKNKVPPFTLQLLIENAIKHNSISTEKNLLIELLYENDVIIVSNNLQPKFIKEPSTGIGQQNISDRYRLLGGNMPEFGPEGNKYVARIPLVKTEMAYELRNN